MERQNEKETMYRVDRDKFVIDEFCTFDSMEMLSLNFKVKQFFFLLLHCIRLVAKVKLNSPFEKL